MPYAAGSYTEILCWQEGTPISYVPHGKKVGTKSYDRYQAYSKARTVGEALELGSKPLDLVNDFEKRILKRVGGPVRESPLNLLEVQDTSTLTKTDLIMARWGYQISREKESQGGEKSGEGELSQVKAFQKALAEAKQGLQPEDMPQGPQWSESTEMMAKRTRADAEATTVLEEAAVEGRKINDEDVVRVLRLWAVRKNLDRKSVFPEGAKFVYSETLGLKNVSGGKILTTLHAKQYPKVLLLLTQWMKDNRPEGYTKDFPFTSIIVNRGFAAKRHRDSVNTGPTVVKAFGNCRGGRLRYWADDDKSRPLDDLLETDAVTVDHHSAPAVIDGNRAHAVEPYTGEERFSLVFFTVHSYEKASAEEREQLTQVGIPFPDEATMAYAKSLLPAPTGYAAYVERAKGAKETSEAKKAISFLKGLKKQKQGPLLSKMMAMRQAIKPPAPSTPSGGGSGSSSSSCGVVPSAAAPAAAVSTAAAEAAASESKPENDEPMALATERQESPGPGSTPPPATPSEQKPELKPKFPLATRGLLARVLAKRAGGEKAASLSAPKLKPSRAPKKPNTDGSLMFKAQKRTVEEMTMEASTAADEGSTAAVDGSGGSPAKAAKGSTAAVEGRAGSPAKATKAAAKTQAKDKSTPEPKRRRREDSAKQQQLTLSAEKPDLPGDLKSLKRAAAASVGGVTEKSSQPDSGAAKETAAEQQAAGAADMPMKDVLARVAEPAAPIAAPAAVQEGGCHEFLSFAKVLSLAAGDTLEASDSVAHFLTVLTRDGAAKKPETALRSAMVLMEPTNAIPARAISAGITKAFGMLCQPNVLGEVLAAEALQGRKSTPGPEPSVEPLTVAEVAAVLAARCADMETDDEWQAVVGEVGKLLARTRQGMEAFFVVRALQGKLAPRREVAQRGIAKAMVELSGC